MPPKKRSKKGEVGSSNVDVESPLPDRFTDWPILIGKSIDVVELSLEALHLG